MGLKARPPRKVTTSGRVVDSESLMRALLEAVWCANYGTIAPPASGPLSVELSGSVITVSSSDWVETGDLASAQSFAERVWWRLGWSMLRDCARARNADASVKRPRREFYRQAALRNVAEHIRDATLEAEDRELIPDLFGERRSASRTALLGRAAELMDDPRAVRRFHVVMHAATFVAGCHWEDPYTVVDRARPILDAALADSTAFVREAGGLLLEQLGCYATAGGAYDAAIPLLDRGLSHGTCVALQHHRRWRARLALGESPLAESDWHAFSGYVDRVAALTGDASWALARDVARIDGLIEAAHAAVALRDGWPTAAVRRERAKHARPPGADVARAHEAHREALVAEAAQRINALPDPFKLPLHVATQYIQFNGLDRARKVLGEVS